MPLSLALLRKSSTCTPTDPKDFISNILSRFSLFSNDIAVDIGRTLNKFHNSFVAHPVTLCHSFTSFVRHFYETQLRISIFDSYNSNYNSISDTYSYDPNHHYNITVSLSPIPLYLYKASMFDEIEFSYNATLDHKLFAQYTTADPSEIITAIASMFKQLSDRVKELTPDTSNTNPTFVAMLTDILKDYGQTITGDLDCLSNPIYHKDTPHIINLPSIKPSEIAKCHNIELVFDLGKKMINLINEASVIHPTEADYQVYDLLATKINKAIDDTLKEVITDKFINAPKSLDEAIHHNKHHLSTEA